MTMIAEITLDGGYKKWLDRGKIFRIIVTIRER
jgi:hypothetical protein